MKPNPIKPGPNQESVWDYPRPPRLEDTTKHIQVVFNGVIIADTTHAKRVLETSHPPTYYIPPQDIKMAYLILETGASFCEWKGQANYYSVLVNNKKATRCAWYYPNPTPNFKAIKNHITFYPNLMEACYVAGELVKPQPGGFYGGWITQDIVGPFKGGPGTQGW